MVLRYETPQYSFLTYGVAHSIPYILSKSFKSFFDVHQSRNICLWTSWGYVASEKIIYVNYSCHCRSTLVSWWPRQYKERNNNVLCSTSSHTTPIPFSPPFPFPFQPRDTWNGKLNCTLFPHPVCTLSYSSSPCCKNIGVGVGSSSLVTWFLLFELAPASSENDCKINNVRGKQSALVDTNED